MKTPITLGEARKRALNAIDISELLRRKIQSYEVESENPIIPDSSVCQLNSEAKQCCCNCVYHLPVYYHCSTAAKAENTVGKCACNKHKGWACVCIPMSDDNGQTLKGVRVYDNWPMHSCGCECYTPKEEGKKPICPTCGNPTCPGAQRSDECPVWESRTDGETEYVPRKEDVPM